MCWIVSPSIDHRLNLFPEDSLLTEILFLKDAAMNYIKYRLVVANNHSSLLQSNPVL